MIRTSTPLPMYISTSFQSCADAWLERPGVPAPAVFTRQMEVLDELASCLASGVPISTGVVNGNQRR
jgi:hypothetical protein